MTRLRSVGLAVALVILGAATVPFLGAQVPTTILNPASDLAGKTLVTAEGNRTISGQFTFTTAPILPTGTVSTPGLSSNIDQTTGWNLGSGTISGSLGGVQRFLLDGNGLTIYGKTVIDPTGIISKAIRISTTAKNANYTASAGDFVLCTGTFTVTLPLATNNTNQFVDVKNVSSGVITIGRSGADQIDGATSQSLAVQNQSMTFVSDGTNWWIR